MHNNHFTKTENIYIMYRQRMLVKLNAQVPKTQNKRILHIVCFYRKHQS